MRLYHNFIGIDISKNEFHVAIHGSNKVTQFSNTAKGFQEFKQINQATLDDGFVVLEATGGYEAALLKYLSHNNIAAHQANTRVVKNFIRSLSKLGKSDTIDALGLARYAKERHEGLKLYIEIPAPEKELVQLAARYTVNSNIF